MPIGVKAPNRQMAQSPDFIRANLRYVTDDEEGIRRERRGSAFTYRRADGRLVRDAATLNRISRLAIPPAWADVWICSDPTGHLQATGRDARGRKQYRYHDSWSQISSRSKYDHVLEFAEILPQLRRAVQRDMRRPKLDNRRVIAGLVRLLDATLIRIGNDCYVQQNDSYGLTTLRDHHVKFIGNGRARLRFKGKSGQNHELEVGDRKLVRLIRHCHDLPGYRLFQYVDEHGDQHAIGSGEVNDYIREVAGCDDLSAKDFRTWGGTTGAAVTLAAMGPPPPGRACDKRITAAVKQVACQLGNRPAACRKYYIHPAIFDAYRTGELLEYLDGKMAGNRIPPRTGMAPQERAVKALLENKARRLMKGKAA